MKRCSQSFVSGLPGGQRRSSLWAPNQQEGQEAAAHIALLRARGAPSSAHIHAASVWPHSF